MSDINLCGKRAAGDLLSRCTCSFNLSLQYWERGKMEKKCKLFRLTMVQ